MINYSYIAQTIINYQSMGFKYVEVPWYVTEDVLNITKPSFSNVDYYLQANDKYLLASGEQGFLYLIMKGVIPSGKYVTCTPCYRFERQDFLHRKVFMKVEAINFVNLLDNDINKLLNVDDVDQMVQTAILNFNNIVTSDYRVVPQSTRSSVDIINPIDIELNSVEIGSYGLRQYKNLVKWVYGTAIAEPRFSVAHNYLTENKL